VREAAPEAEGELAIGFFGARYDRATPAERDYMRAMADLGVHTGDGAVTTADIARTLGRKPQSLSPARDGLIKKGLVYSSERGTVAFTVPHFGKFLRSQGG
jgi:DNA-binding MarR family transcriptional regulator